MATRALFDELLTLYAHDEAVGIRIEAAGGVEVVRRIETGENFDLVVFASDAIDRLITAGLLLVGSTVDRCAF